MSPSQCSFNANLKTHKNLQGRLKKYFAYETKFYSKMSVWKNMNFIWHSFQTFTFSFLPRYIGYMTSQRLCSSLHIAINSSRSWDFADILKEMLKIFQSLAFLLCSNSTFDLCFLKKRVQVSHVSVKLVITIEKIWNLDESWTRPTFLQLTVH